jgi:hypothetical protein
MVDGFAALGTSFSLSPQHRLRNRVKSRHQKQRRVEAHILVCFLAYGLWKTLEQWQARAGLGNSPRTILDELGRIQSTDVVLPLADEPGRELPIRCVVRPDQAQSTLLDRLGLELPQRLHSSKCSANF